MTESNLSLAGSTWGFFFNREPETWLSIPQAIEELKSIGFGVEVWTNRGWDEPWLTEQLAREIAEACAGASHVSVHTRPEHWQWDPHGLSDEVEFCSLIGASALILHPNSLGFEGTSPHPDFPGIRRLAAQARDLGVRLVLENTPNTMWALDLALDEIGDDPQETNLGICIDVGHAYISQDAGREPIRNYIERYKGQLVHLHLHDNFGDADDHLPLQEGSIDWQNLADTLKAIDYHGPAVLELQRQGDLLAAFTDARDYLRSLGL
ncbi:sugar phosphate isomerase/epimerase [Candidatus Bipolaricaulota bacterium]|nr:sugar phosphate isomerase/epimerase [Candidatus Bipolaricaulota bacterium]